MTQVEISDKNLLSMTNIGSQLEITNQSSKMDDYGRMRSKHSIKSTMSNKPNRSKISLKGDSKAKGLLLVGA